MREDATDFEFARRRPNKLIQFYYLCLDEVCNGIITITSRILRGNKSEEFINACRLRVVTTECEYEVPATWVASESFHRYGRAFVVVLGRGKDEGDEVTPRKISIYLSQLRRRDQVFGVNLRSLG